MNKQELKQHLSYHSEGFKLPIMVETANFVICQDCIHSEFIEVIWYCEYMVESEIISIKWDLFQEFLESRGIDTDKDLYEYLHGGVENKHVQEMFNDWIKLQ